MHNTQLEPISVGVGVCVWGVGGVWCGSPPAPATAQDGTYTPLSRPLYVYAKKSSFDDNEDVRNFVKFMFDNNETIAEETLFVPLSAEQIAEQRTKYEDAAA